RLRFMAWKKCRGPASGSFASATVCFRAPTAGPPRRDERSGVKATTLFFAPKPSCCHSEEAALDADEGQSAFGFAFFKKRMPHPPGQPPADNRSRRVGMIPL